MTLARSLLFVAAAAGVAGAQSAPAEALFREGRQLIKSGKLELGCDKLAASDKLESSVGTLLNLGDCREKLGQTATAWAAFRKAEAMAKRAGNDPKREAEARRRAAKLERDLPNIVVQVGASTPGIVIRRDGEPLDAAAFDTPMPVDPGTHTIVAEAPGYKPFRAEVQLMKGGKRYVVVPSLDKVPEPVAVTPPPPAPAVPHETTVVVDDPGPLAAPRYITTQETWSGARKAALAVGVVGAAALGAGVYFGLRANDLEQEADAICPTSTCDDAEGLRLNDDAQTSAQRANIALIGGGVAIAGAAVLWFVGAPEERTVIAPAIGPDHVGATLAGRF